MNDIAIARRYISKHDQAAVKGHEFSLTLRAFTNLMKAKRCGLTGLPLTPKTVTVDRLDNSLGYVSGNVMAVHTSVNNLKSIIECPNNGLTFKNVTRMLKVLDKRIK